jgi:hypothetical protein
MTKGVIGVLCLLAAAWSRPAAPPVPVAFEHVNVIDATGSPPSSDMTVTTVDGRIATIEPSARARVAANAQRIDGRRRFLIPGLWDMHVHLTSTTEIACPALVANGITGVRDMGGDLSLIDWMRDRIERGELTGPAIFRSGPFVDGSKPGVPDRLVLWHAADGRAAARFLKNRGVDYIKTHTAAPRDAYFALLSESRRVGLAVVWHVTLHVTPEEAIDGGQHSIEHIVALARFTEIEEVVKRRGVRFLVGTDLGSKYIYPGFSVHDELALLRTAGLTSMEFLRAASRVPRAAAAGLADA